MATIKGRKYGYLKGFLKYVYICALGFRVAFYIIPECCSKPPSNI